MFLQTGDHRVLPDIQDSEDTGGTAFLRQKCKTVFNGLSGIAVSDLFAVQFDHTVFSDPFFQKFHGRVLPCPY